MKPRHFLIFKERNLTVEISIWKLHMVNPFKWKWDITHIKKGCMSKMQINKLKIFEQQKIIRTRIKQVTTKEITLTTNLKGIIKHLFAQKTNSWLYFFL